MGNNWSQNTAAANSVSGNKSMQVLLGVNYPNAWAITPALNLTAGRSYRVSYFYKTNNSSQPKKLKVTMGPTVSYSSQTTILHNYTSILNTSFAEGVDVFTASASGNFYFGFNGTYPWYSGSGDLFLDSIVIAKILSPCTGMPATGVASGPATICPATNFTISMAGNYIDDNIVFQWQSSNPGANSFSDITGSVSQNLTTSQNTGKDYRCKVTCTSSGLFSVSNIVSVASPAFCYCIPIGYCNVVNPITNVSFAGINNTSACINSGYADYTSSVSAANATGGTIVPISITIGGGGIGYAAAWVDYNNNGSFEQSEYKYLGSGNNSTIPGTLFIPSSVTGGMKRIRIRVRPVTNLGPGDACTGYISGDTEDYGVIVTPAKISILHTAFPDTLYNTIFNINADIRQIDVGINTNTPFKPRIWARKQGSSTWKSFPGIITAGNATNGTWQFPVKHDSLGIRRNGCDSVQYYFVAQDINSPVNIGYLPEPGALHTDVLTQVITPPVLFGYRIKPRLKDTVFVSAYDCRYTSLSAEGGIFNEITKRGLEGDLTIIIESDLFETGKYAVKDSFQNGFKINIRPDGNTVRTIHHDYSVYNAAGQTGAIQLIGAKRITIDGSYQGTGEYLKFVSDYAGYFINGYDTVCSVRISDGADSISIKNCLFNMDRTSSDIAEASIVVAQGINRNISVLNNLFGTLTVSRMTDRHLVSIRGNNTLLIQGNRFDNFRQSAINMPTGCNNWIIDSNHFYRTLLQSDYGLSTEAINVGGSGHRISGNYIGGSAPFCGGAPFKFINIAGSEISGIKITPAASGVADTIINNRIDNIDANTTASYIAPASMFAGIFCNDNNCVIRNNIVGNPMSSMASINVFAGNIYGILSYGSRGNEISGNVVSAFKNYGSYASGVVRMYGIYRSNTANGVLVSLAQSIVSNNKVSNLSNTLNGEGYNSNVYSDLGGTGGIFVQGGFGNVIDHNEVHNIAVGDNHVTGILYTGGSGSVTSQTTSITGNRIYDLYNPTQVATSCSCGSNDDALNGIMNGIGLNNDNAPVDIVNNQIFLNNRNVASPISMRGIFNAYSSTTTSRVRIMYNTVYLGGVATVNGGSAGYFSLQGQVNKLLNNIFYTERTGGTKGHYAYRFYTQLPVGYPNRSDNNLFVLPDITRFADHGNGYVANFTTWKPLAHADSASYLTLPSVIPGSQFFTDQANGNLNINTTSDICWYAHGKGLPVAGIPADYDSANIRSVAIQTGATDIGSDEFTTTTLPPILTVFGFHAPGGADTLSFNGRVVGIITWGSGGLLPTLGPCRWFSGEWPNDPTNNGSVINAHYLNAYWSIPVTGGSNYSYSLKLFYDSSVLGKVVSAADMVANKKEINVAGTWHIVSPTQNNINERSFVINNQVSFSEFTATDQLFTLPMGVVLRATLVNNEAMLVWNALPYGNILSYDVEKSTDGINFSKAATVSAGISALTQFTDAPAFKGESLIFYRLKINVAAGSHSYSNIVSFKNGAAINMVIGSIYPNPFNDHISFDITTAYTQLVNLSITAADGRVMENSTVKVNEGISTLTINMPSSYIAGIYILKIAAGDKIFTYKLVKQ
ncbi:MAG: GEVED domain-containing protein [Ferruginibacter sp.]